jgi:hypothetical protein
VFGADLEIRFILYLKKVRKKTGLLRVLLNIHYCLGFLRQNKIRNEDRNDQMEFCSFNQILNFSFNRKALLKTKNQDEPKAKFHYGSECQYTCFTFSII